MLSRKYWLAAIVALTTLALVLPACGATSTPTQPAATIAPTQVSPTAAAPTKVPPTATKVPPTPTAGPTVGGKMVIVLEADPDTLDHQKSAMGVTSNIMEQVNGSLVAVDPMTNEAVPYLADSWTISPDGLTVTFKLHAGVKFHDGSPLTAKDWAWTLTRGVDPATESPSTGPYLASMDKAEAVDDATLKLTLKEPNFPLLLNLAWRSYLGPLSQAYVEKMGDKYGRNPIGVGPFKFKEWVTGSKIVLERNPDYNWAPAFQHEGPAYVQTVEYRIIPEYSTAIAGLEAGDIDLYRTQTVQDIQHLKDAKLNVRETYVQGMNPYVGWNNGKWPFDDVNVRKALSYAMDGNAIIKAVALGQAVLQHGLVSPSMTGYDAAQEAMGYDFDLAKAKALLAEDGWVAGADGILVKDGKRFEVTMMVVAGDPTSVKVAQSLEQQWKAVGVRLTISQVDQATLIGGMMSGEVQVGIGGIGWQDMDVYVTVFGSNRINGMGFGIPDDDELDRLLLLTRTTTDPVKRQEAVNTVVKYMMDKAYVLPIFAQKGFYLFNNRIQGVNLKDASDILWLNDLYVQAK